jgi:uncharacterized protein YrrD
MHTQTQDPNVLHFLGDLPLTLKPKDDVRGKNVHDSTGKVIGHVHELVVSHEGARIMFLEVEHRNVFKMDKYLIPVEDIVVRGTDLYVKGEGDCTDETPWNCPELLAKSVTMTAGD